MENKTNNIINIAENLKRSLIALDVNLLYYDDSPLGKELFVDCKFEQQNALDYINQILRILKSSPS